MSSLIVLYDLGRLWNTRPAMTGQQLETEEYFFHKFLAKNQPEVNNVKIVFVHDVVHHTRVSSVHATHSNHIHDFSCDCVRLAIFNLHF